MRRLIGAGGLYVFGTVAPILVLLAITPVITRILGANQYAQVAIAVSVYQFASVLVAAGLPIVVTRDALASDIGFRGASGLVMAGSAVAGALGTLGALSTSIWGQLLFPGVDPGVLSAAVVAGTGLAVITLAQALLRAAERVTRFVVLGIMAALLGPVLGLLAMFAIGSSAAVYAWGLGAGYAIVAGVALASTALLARPGVALREVRRAYRVGLPTVPHALAVPLLLTFSMSIVTHTVGLDAAGPLQIAALLGTAIITVMNAVNNAWVPLVFKASGEARPRVLAQSTFAISILLALLMCGFTVLVPLMAAFIGGPTVSGSGVAHVAALIATSSVPHLLYLANIHLTFLSGRTGLLAVLTPISAMIALGAIAAAARVDPAGVPSTFGLVWLIFYALQAVFSYILARRTGYAPVDLRSAAGPLAIATAVGLQAALVDPQPFVSVIAAVPTMALLGWLVLRWRRSPVGLEHGASG